MLKRLGRVRKYPFVSNAWHPLTIGLAVGYVAGVRDHEEMHLVGIGIVYAVLYVLALLYHAWV